MFPADEVLTDPKFVKAVADKYIKVMDSITSVDSGMDKNTINDFALSWFNVAIPENLELERG